MERGWSALPPEYRIPAQRPTLEQARAYCRRLATTHYENFHVASWFLPARLRPHFYSIYAYCRIADDLGDEIGNREQSLALLDLWGRELDACYRGEARHPVFVALAETIRACDIPQKPFADLLVAFRQDQTVMRYRTMEDVLGYCAILRQSGRTAGSLCLRLSRCGEVPAFRLHLLRFAAGKFLAGREPRLCAGQDLPAAGGDGALSAWTRRRLHGATQPRLFASCCAMRWTMRARCCSGLAADRVGRSGAGARSRSVQPRRPGDFARHRAQAIRRAHARAR